MNDDDVALLAEQRAYYRARAPEYDQWWLRSGRYALPGEERDRWRAEIALLEQAFDEFAPRGEVLELACGTGLWSTASCASPIGSPLAARLGALGWDVTMTSTGPSFMLGCGGRMVHP